MKLLAPISAALLVLAAITPINADVIYTGIDINEQLNFTDPYFADATWTATLTLTIAPGSSGSKDFDLLFYPYNYGLTFFSTGDVTLDKTSAPPQTPETTLHVTANGGGTFGFRESGGWVEGVPGAIGTMFLFTSSLTGRRDMEYVAPSGGYSLHLDPGITWRTTVSMPGDWSATSSGNVQGTHYLFGYDPDWSLTSDFVYNPATNQTVLSLFNPNYAGADSEHDGPYPDFALVGPVVPEPAEVALSAVGLTIIAAFLARRRCRA